MTKQKEKAPDGDNARVRFALYTDEATLEQVKQNYKQDGCSICVPLCLPSYLSGSLRRCGWATTPQSTVVWLQNKVYSFFMSVFDSVQ